MRPGRVSTHHTDVVLTIGFSRSESALQDGASVIVRKIVRPLDVNVTDSLVPTIFVLEVATSLVSAEYNSACTIVILPLILHSIEGYRFKGALFYTGIST